jgi:hypothetical protein
LDIGCKTCYLTCGSGSVLCFAHIDHREDAVPPTYEPIEEVDCGDPLLTQLDVLGLYRPDVAAAASRATACDPGSGPCRIDD